MTDSQWQRIKWRARADGSIEFEMRLGQRGHDLFMGALDVAHAELDRTRGPIAGGVDASTPEAERRRADALGLVVERLTRAMEIGFPAERLERSRTPSRGSGRGA